MARFSRQAADEVASKDADASQRRTRPADKGPYSPKHVDDLYAKGAKLNPHPRGTVGDGLTDRKTRERDIRLQKPQDPIEDREPTYLNDVPLMGDTAWLRGGGEGHRPNMDTGKLDRSDRPCKPAKGLNASGSDMKSSPFSAAHRTYSED
jgi:hypothetical protein